MFTVFVQCRLVTDGETVDDSIYRASNTSIASRGKMFEQAKPEKTVEL